jgi:hypothetical protein
MLPSMVTFEGSMHRSQLYLKRILMLFRIGFVAIPLLICSTWIHAQSPSENGLVWEMQGSWRLNHEQQHLRTGDDVVPGAVLTADTATNGSILVLLPDGQRLLFDCHDANTCSQGFRIPALIAKPDKDDIELFETIKLEMQKPSLAISLGKAPRISTITEIESVVRIQNDGTILLKQPLAALPPGQYRLTTQGDSQAQPSEHSLTWSGSHDESHLTLSGPGFYQLRLFGNLGTERMRVVLLAVPPTAFSDTEKFFAEARKTLQEWNETFPGWPMHEWLQLYLRSLSEAGPEKNSSEQ